MTTMPVRDVSLFVEVVGRGHPLALMHGGPGADHCTLLRFGGAYHHDPSLMLLARELLRGGWRTKTRPEALSRSCWVTVATPS